MDRRHNDPQTPHERARILASDRLDGELSPTDAGWLDAHLRGCDECRSVAAAYEEDRDLLRAMPQPEPPRDLWARTSVALERERSAGVGRTRLALGDRRGWHVRWEAAAGIVAVLLIGVVVGRSLLISDQAGVGVATGSSGPGASAVVGPTPLIVTPGSVAWAAPNANGSYTVNVANVDSVCPQGPLTDPGCASLDVGAQAVASLKSKPGSVVLDPDQEQAAVVESGASTTGGSIIVVPISRPKPSPSPSPAATPKPTPTGSAPASSTPRPSPSPSAGAGTSPSPSGSPGGTPAASPSPSPTATPEPTDSPEPSPTVSASPAPTPTEAAAALAIINDVIVVGGDAAYSADGEWLAFSARPSDGSHGPDVFVWRVGDTSARPLTTDHRSVFSDWVDGRVLVSRVIPADHETDAASPAADDGQVKLAPARPGHRQAARADDRRSVAPGGRSDRPVGGLLDR